MPRDAPWAPSIEPVLLKGSAGGCEDRCRDAPMGKITAQSWLRGAAGNTRGGLLLRITRPDFRLRLRCSGLPYFCPMCARTEPASPYMSLADFSPGVIDRLCTTHRCCDWCCRRTLRNSAIQRRAGPSPGSTVSALIRRSPSVAMDSISVWVNGHGGCIGYRLLREVATAGARTHAVHRFESWMRRFL